MTKERREDVVLIALVVSVAIHIGLMLLVKPQIMTHVVSQQPRTVRREPMRVTQSVLAPDLIRIEELLDLKAKKDAPAAVGDQAAPVAEAPTVTDSAAEVPQANAPILSDPAVETTPMLETHSLTTDQSSETALAIPKFETPKMAAGAITAPDFSVAVPTVAHAAEPTEPVFDSAPDAVMLPSRLGSKIDEKDIERVTFRPAQEIYEKVDEQIVAEEKRAVKAMVNAVDAADLVKFVNLTMTAATADGWRYFRVMMTPRQDLKIVPKDVVLIIDGSGSIGNDRLGSCRKAARQILRTCTNSGDRFNLVVFRNAFSYAFRNWRECDAASFEAGEKWLSNQTAHGRTDVFSTISSVLTLPRDPKRPLIALVVTDGDANAGVSNTAEILSKFTALNDGLVSVYMYGVKSSANRELIDVLTHGNRGESFVFDGWRWNAGSGMEGLSERFRDPVLSDLRVVFASGVQVEAYPRLLRNLYRGGTLEFVGRVPAAAQELAFSLKGLNGDEAYEGFFKIPFATAPNDKSIIPAWKGELAIDRKLGTR